MAKRSPVEQIEEAEKKNPRHQFIKGYLTMQGVSFADIARETGMSRVMVTLTSRGERRSPDIEEAFIKHGIPRAFLNAI
ncbi:MAG: hypothetical protein WAN11_05960 [Syntrophobacteraceae bacterium]